jgi:peptide/nickel transport system permease protein
MQPSTPGSGIPSIAASGPSAAVRAAAGGARWRQTVRRARRHRGATMGFVITAALVLVAVFQNAVAPLSPVRIDVADALVSPGPRHLMGTDEYGRDIYSRVVHGSGISLSVGLISVGIAATAGTAIGLLAGYQGGPLDGFLMRVIDVMLAFPGILLALGIVSVLGPSLRNLMIAVGIAGIPVYARLVRGSVLVAREQLYVDAARVTGVPVAVILTRHILPNVVAPVIVAGTLGMGTAILAAAALSFIGLGSQPPTPEWGRMLSEGRDYLRDAWWISTFPGLAIMVTVLGVNMLGDGLRDVLDPRLKI